MRLTDQELKMHNDKVLKIAELRCAESNIPGITVSYPDFMKGDRGKVQLALPCGIIRSEKRKVNAMQVRTGAFTVSLAKEKTKYDDRIDTCYNDPTDYMPFIPDSSGEHGHMVDHKVDFEDTTDTKSLTVQGIVVKKSKGILDL
jgi:hypothetical protein